ncbi:MAG: hypothetical protein N2235_19065 [Fischerella sp.]|nr:hypothetical protein [Fischerella sp.]
MSVEFRKSFEKDLGHIRDEALLQRIKLVIEEVENAENLKDAGNLKNSKLTVTIISRNCRLQNRSDSI